MQDAVHKIKQFNCVDCAYRLLAMYIAFDLYTSPSFNWM